MKYSFLTLAALIALGSIAEADGFLQRGHNPGHIFGNTVRRVYWGPDYDSYGYSSSNYSSYSYSQSYSNYSYSSQPRSRRRRNR